MFNHVCEEEIDHSWVPASAQLRLRFREEASLAREYADLLDEVPVMSATVLGLDMILQEPYVDLRSVSDLILSDVGATIQILRLIRREYDFAADRPSRIGECLASLDVKTWYRAVSARTFACDRKNAAIAALWKHCREIAQYAQLVVHGGHCPGRRISGGAAPRHCRNSTRARLANFGDDGESRKRIAGNGRDAAGFCARCIARPERFQSYLWMEIHPDSGA